MRKQRAFAGLTEAEIKQIARWLQHGKYQDVRVRIAKPRPEGFGLELNSTRRQAFTSKVDLCQFTPGLKAELFPRLRTAFEQRIVRIPISREIREDLHAIQRTVTQSGQITYRAPQSADGHSDRTTALALALRAATSAPVSACATTVFVPEGSLRRNIPFRRNWNRRVSL
jgi:phage FluMu gp28-like protein